MLENAGTCCMTLAYMVLCHMIMLHMRYYARRCCIVLVDTVLYEYQILYYMSTCCIMLEVVVLC